MSSDGDKPQRLTGSAAGVRDLRVWAGRVVGGALLRKGLPKAAVETIIEETFRELATFEKSVAKPVRFVVKRALDKVRVYMRLRAIEPAADPVTEIPHALLIVRTQAALDTLPANAREALRMVFHERKSFGVVAAELDVSIPYVKRLVRNALTTLRKWTPPPEYGP
jgi:Sigma-70, region 4